MNRSRMALFVAGVIMGSYPAFSASAPKIQDLLVSLGDDDDVTARAAQDLLLKLGPESVRPLERALSDPSFRVRRRAAEVLAALSPVARDSASDLVGLLTDPQPDVREAAQKALYAIGDDAVQALMIALESTQDGVRKMALSTLSGCGPKGIPAILKRLKKDQSEIVRASAAEALQSVKNQIGRAHV